MSLDEWVGHGIPDEVIDAAIGWVAKLDSDDLSETQRQAFFIWLDEDPTHRWAFEELSEIWAKSSMLKDQEHLVERSHILHFPSMNNRDKEQKASLTFNPSYLAIGFIVFGFLSSIFF